MNVLIIDNNKAQQTLLSAVIRRIEPTAQVFPSTCTSALRNIRTIPHLDYITLEQRLKESDGIELVPLIKENLPNCKIIMITTKCNTTLQAKASEIGINCLLKPISESKLRKIIL